jgi:hypothetical protein
MNKLKALAMMLAYLNDFHNPESLAFRNANPGLLKAFSLKHKMDANQVRIFDSFQDGYQALNFDLKTKCSGRSRSKLKPENTLTDLLRVYGHAETERAVRFLQSALHTDINEKQPLAFFSQE